MEMYLINLWRLNIFYSMRNLSYMPLDAKYNYSLLAVLQITRFLNIATFVSGHLPIAKIQDSLTKYLSYLWLHIKWNICYWNVKFYFHEIYSLWKHFMFCVLLVLILFSVFLIYLKIIEVYSFVLQPVTAK